MLSFLPNCLCSQTNVLLFISFTMFSHKSISQFVTLRCSSSANFFAPVSSLLTIIYCCFWIVVAFLQLSLSNTLFRRINHCQSYCCFVYFRFGILSNSFILHAYFMTPLLSFLSFSQLFKSGDFLKFVVSYLHFLSIICSFSPVCLHIFIFILVYFFTLLQFLFSA